MGAEVLLLDKILNSKFQRGLRHSAMWTLSSMVLFLQEYCKLCFSKWMKKWKFVMWWNPLYAKFPSYSGYLKKVKVLYTFHIIKIHHMLQFLHIVDIKKSESVVHISYYENPPYAAFSSYVDYSSFETIIISKILLHTLLSGPSLAGRPLEDQPSYHIMMKNHHMLESHHVIESHINLQ